jgi:hypothetical protein
LKGIKNKDMRVIRILSIVLVMAFITTLSVKAIQITKTNTEMISSADEDKTPDDDKKKKAETKKKADLSKKASKCESSCSKTTSSKDCKSACKSTSTAAKCCSSKGTKK